MSDCEARCSKQGTGQDEAHFRSAIPQHPYHLTRDVCKSDQSDLTDLHYPLPTPSHKPNLTAVDFDDSSSYNGLNPKYNL